MQFNFSIPIKNDRKIMKELKVNLVLSYLIKYYTGVFSLKYGFFAHLKSNNHRNVIFFRLSSNFIWLHFMLKDLFICYSKIKLYT